MGRRTLIVEAVEKESTVLGLRSEWDRLVEESVYPNVVLTFEWIWPWWKNFGIGTMSVYTVRENGVLLGIFPLAKVNRRYLGIPYVSLESMANVHTPRFDFIVKKGKEAEVFQSWIYHVTTEKDSWQVLDIKYLPRVSRTPHFLEAGIQSRVFRFRKVQSIVSPILVLDTNWEGFFASLSKSFRKNVRYAERKFEQQEALSLVKVQGGPDLIKKLDRAFEIESCGWKGEEGTAMASSGNSYNFYREVALLCSEKGWFILYFLLVGKHEVAFDYCLQYGETMNLVKIGYEEDKFSKYSPGVVLRKRVLEDLFKEGKFKKYDMLGTCSPWKMKWTKDVTILDRIFVYRNGIIPAVVFGLQFGLPELVKKLPFVNRKNTNYL